MPLPPDIHRLLPAFLSAAQNDNFSAAARKLGVTPAAISKNIRVLEEKLSLRLFARNTHSVVLTDEGKALLQEVEPLWRALSSTLENSASSNRQPSGSVRVSAIPGFAQQQLIPLLPNFLAQYPELNLDLALDARVVNLVAEGFDVGIGNRVDPDSRLIARQLRPMRTMYAASADYLAQHPPLNTPQDLVHHSCLLHRNASTNQIIKWDLADSVPQGELSGRVVSTRPESLISSAINGLGVVGVAGWYIEPHLKSGALVPVLEDFWTAGVPLWLYYSSADLPPRVRVWVDFILEHFQP